MPQETTPRPDKGATLRARQQAEQLDAAAQRCWDAAVSMDPRVRAIINATMGGKLTFEQMAEAMWCIGFISGYGGARGAIEQAAGPCVECPTYMGKCPKCGRD